MNIKQMRYFTAVVDSGSLSAAAKNQQVTVQAVSKSIADLERELGQSLFVRESRGVRSTLFGAAFYQRALPVLRDFNELEQFAKTYRENQPYAKVRIALYAPPFYRSDYALTRIALFIKRRLNIDATVELALGDSAKGALLEGELDVLITIGTLSVPGAHCVSIGTVTPGVLMAKTHPLVAKRTIDLADLKAFPVQTAAAFDTFSDVIEPAYRARGVEVCRSDGTSSQLEDFLTHNQGLSFVAGIPVLGELYPGVEMRLISPDDAVAIPVCLVSLKQGKPASVRLLEHWLTHERIFFGGGPTEETLR